VQAAGGPFFSPREDVMGLRSLAIIVLLLVCGGRTSSAAVSADLPAADAQTTVDKLGLGPTKL
jgi:hypothetical protein